MLLAPGLFILVSDALRRRSQLVTFDRLHTLGYVATVAASLAFWAVLLHAASPRRGAVRQAAAAVFVTLFTLAAGVQAAYHGLHNVYCSHDSQIHSDSFLWPIICTLPLDHPAVILHLAFALGLSLGAIRLARRVLEPRPMAATATAVIGVLAIAGVTRMPASYRLWQSTAPDMIYFHGLTAAVKENLGLTNDAPDRRVQLRRPAKVPKLTARPARPRNVLLILQESQRYDVTCVDYDPQCPLATPFSNQAAPGRMPLHQMRAHDSTTAISISNLWSGIPATEGFEVLHTAPLMWEFAHAAGWDTAYWTSQHTEFGNMRLFLQASPMSIRAYAAHLDPRADLDAGAYDRLVTDRVIADWDRLREPFFAVVQYSNIHYPYVCDPEHCPFQPSAHDKAPEKNETFRNYYKNTVYLSDMAAGRLIEHVRRSPAGPQTIIVYTADHGEGFRDHWQLGHTSSLYEEEIRVPTWIDAPPGTLSPEEEANLRGAKDQQVWHLDLAATFLDFMGLWDDPGLVPFRRKMTGLPITRPERTAGPVPLTNCTWVWECGFRNWGMMQGPMKIEAREWDGEFHCFNLANDPEELVNLGEEACAPLPDLARAFFHEMPIVAPPGKRATYWGPEE